MTDARLTGDASHVVADQGDVAVLLSDPASYTADGAAPDTVDRLDTHASMVFLAGDRAYKVKRAVHFSFMDFSTLDKRRAACARELTLNRRTAPGVYLGVCPIFRDADGGLALGALQPDGPTEPDGTTVVEWVVVMRRFPQDDLLSTRADRGTLDSATMDGLADAVASLHAAAETIQGRGAAALSDIMEGNIQALAEYPELFPPEDVDALAADSRAILSRCRALLDERAMTGCVRRCHGDLHLGNVVLLDGEPTPFDAVEFNDAFAETDVLYDLAFLIMDLGQRGMTAHANRLLNRYLFTRDDIEGLAALPLFLSLRAAIRAKVGASAIASQADDDARQNLADRVRGYFRAARAYLNPSSPSLVAVGGLSGTGKTTLARGLAPAIGAAPGALVVRSDVERKRLFGVGITDPLPEDAYRGRVNARVYDRVLERAKRGLAAGRSVIVEATFMARSDRANARKTAAVHGVAFQGLWLTAPAETLKARVAARRRDASDATPEVVAAQLDRAPAGDIAWPSVDATGSADTVTARARAILRQGTADA